ncbi:MAG: hypothetical protein ACTSX9_00640 [Candidatus Njordarchaeales archaeon]
MVKVKRKIKIPWLPGFYRPKYKLELPEIDLAEEGNRRILFLILAITCAVLASGIIYIAVNLPPAIIGPRVPKLIIPDLNRQTLSEGIIVIALTLMSVLGAFIIRSSVEHFTDVEYQGLYLAFGFALLLFGFLALTYILFAQKLANYISGIIFLT